MSRARPRWNPTKDPWPRPLGSSVPDGVDPRSLPGAMPFDVYTVEENDLHFMVFAENNWAPRLFIAEEPEAIYVVVVDQPAPARTDGVIEGRAPFDFGPTGLHGMLERPLGDRPIVDATRDQVAERRPLRERTPRA